MSGLKAFYFFETARLKIVFTDSETAKRLNESGPLVESGKLLVADDVVPEIIFLDEHCIRVKAVRLIPFSYRSAEVFELEEPILFLGAPGSEPRFLGPP